MMYATQKPQRTRVGYSVLCGYLVNHIGG